jgi:hypothetical protein
MSEEKLSQELQDIIDNLSKELAITKAEFEKLGELYSNKKQVLINLKKQIISKDNRSSSNELIQNEINKLAQLSEQAKQEASKISPKQIQEIMHYQKPPVVIKLVLRALMYLMFKEDFEWKELRAKMIKIDFVEEVLGIEIDKVDPKVVETISKTFIGDPDWDLNKINRSSKAVGPLAEWLTFQIQYLDAVHDLYIDKDKDGTYDQGEEAAALRAAEINRDLDAIMEDRILLKNKIDKIKESLEKAKIVETSEKIPINEAYKRIQIDEFKEPNFPTREPIQEKINVKPTYSTCNSFSIVQQSSKIEPIFEPKDFTVQNNPSIMIQRKKSPIKEAIVPVIPKNRSISPISSYFTKRTQPKEVFPPTKPNERPLSPLSTRSDISTSKITQTSVNINNFVCVQKNLPVENNSMFIKKTVNITELPTKTTTYEKTTITFPDPGLVVVNSQGLAHYSYANAQNGNINASSRTNNSHVLRSMTIVSEPQTVINNPHYVVRSSHSPIYSQSRSVTSTTQNSSNQEINKMPPIIGGNRIDVSHNFIGNQANKPSYIRIDKSQERLPGNYQISQPPKPFNIESKLNSQFESNKSLKSEVESTQHLFLSESPVFKSQVVISHNEPLPGSTQIHKSERPTK